MTPADYYHQYDTGDITYAELAEKVGRWMADHHTQRRREGDSNAE